MSTLPPRDQNRKPRNRQPLSEETKRKISESQRGKVISAETRAKLSAASKGKSPTNKGVSPTEEQKRRARENQPSRKGIPLSEERRRKLAEANRLRNISRRGIPLSEEHRHKLSEGLRRNNHMSGKHHTAETKRKLSEANKGIRRAPFDEQHRKHLSEAATGRVGVNKGKTFSEEHREKMRAAKQGLPQSEAHRASIQAYWDAMTPEERAEKTMHMALAAPGLHSTSIEVMVWDELTVRGIQFEKQERFGRYIVDVYIPEINLAIEVDGCWWHGCLQCGHDSEKDRELRDKDIRRTAYLEAKGCIVVHIWEHDIKRDVVNAVGSALDAVKNRGQ